MFLISVEKEFWKHDKIVHVLPAFNLLDMSKWKITFKKTKKQLLLISIYKWEVNVSMRSLDRDGGAAKFPSAVTHSNVITYRGISSSCRLTIPESFTEQVQEPDVTCWGGSRVFNIEWQGCGALSSETIKLSPLYFCGGTTEAFSHPLRHC